MKGNFGFIHNEIEIKILILFILRRLPEPVSYETLTELTMCDDGISYFDYAECIADLVRTGHLLCENDMYSLTAKGVRNGEIMEKSIPYTVRLKAGNAASLARTAQNRNAMIITSHEPDLSGGFTVRLNLSDGISDIASIKLYAASEQQAYALEQGFRKKAESVYNALIKMLLG
jgi:hypothetical protein